MASPTDFEVAKAQFIKSRRTEVRLRYALMADAEVARSLPEWKAEFEARVRGSVPQVLDLESEARRLLDAGA
jgi:hypothetical protein